MTFPLYDCSEFGNFVITLIHLANRFQKRRLKKSANQKQELPVVGMFVYGSGRNEQSLQGTGPSKDSSYYISVHLDNRFQKRRIKISANQKQEWPVAAMFFNGYRRNQQS